MSKSTYSMGNESIKIVSLSSEQKLTIARWLYQNKRHVKAAQLEWGRIVNLTEGAIVREPKECSGVWGYGGDSIAVWIGNNPYPANIVANLNRGMLPASLQAFFNT